MKDKRTSRFWRTALECLLASIALAVLTFVSFRLHAGPSMAAVLFFFLVVLISLWAGLVTTVFACVVAALCFVYFFTQPLYGLTRMSEPVEIVALVAFTSTALIISRLLSRVRERTAEVQQTNEQLQAEVEERKRAEEKIRQSERELRQLIDAIPQHVVVLEADGSILYVNQVGLDYTGHTLEETVAKDALARTYHADDLERVQGERRNAISRGAAAEVEARIRGADGKYRWFLIRINPLRDEQGRILRWYGTRTDIEDRKRAEDALRRSRADLGEAQSLSHMGSFGWKPSTGELTWSEETYRIFQHDPTTKPTEELVLERIHPEDRSLTQQFLERAAHRDKDYEHEYRLLMPDGSVKYLHIVAHALSDESCSIEFVGAVMDVTAAKRAEEARSYLASIVESSDDAIIGRSMEGIIQSWNRGAERLYGYTAQEAIGQPISMVIPPDRAQEFVSSDRLKQGEPIQELETVRVGKDGRRIDVSVIISPMKDAAGRVFGAATIARDITERKRAEAALRQSEAYLAEGQRLSHTGSWAFDLASNKYIYVSEETFRIFEMDAQEGLPNREAISRLIHPEDRDRVNENFEKSRREKVDASSEFRIVLPSGTVKHLQVIRHPVMNDAGDVVKLVGTLIDMTERKRAEQERERLRQLQADLAHINRVSMLGELAASIAHEVNQPLSGVVVNGNACLRWLAGDSPNLEEAREAVRRIVRDGKRAGDVIARIRALATKTAPAKERLDMNEAIREAVAFAQDEVRRNNVILRVELADALSPVLGDRVQLQQVVLNLVTNGIEAMSSVEDRPRELMIRTQNDDANQVRVTVQDSGMGLDPQSMERIFDAFYTTKRGGMGMGLSISRSIIQNHGGKLWAVANDGPGMSVRFTISKYQQ